MTFKDILQELKKEHFAQIPIEITQEELAQAAGKFLDFLTLPLNVKDQFFFKIDEESHRTNVGYTRRHKDLGHADNKEYFHYHALAQERFLPRIDSSSECARVFLESAEHIFQKASLALRYVLDIFEEGVPGITATFFDSHEFPSFYLRFLKYDVQGVGSFLARGHYDTGAITFALAESAPGLRIGRHDGDLREAPPRLSGCALFMPALRICELAPVLAGVTPAWHDVVQKSGDTYSSTIARWAIVFFADPTYRNRLSSEDAHTPRYE